jgi:hypothetical protein
MAVQISVIFKGHGNVTWLNKNAVQSPNKIGVKNWGGGGVKGLDYFCKINMTPLNITYIVIA